MQWFRNLRLQAKLTLNAGVLIALAGLQSAVVYRVTRDHQEKARWREHTVEVISHATAASNALVNMETGYRGFVITGTRSTSRRTAPVKRRPRPSWRSSAS
jgi:methyl-accepting chemotaxis protein